MFWKKKSSPKKNPVVPSQKTKETELGTFYFEENDQEWICLVNEEDFVLIGEEFREEALQRLVEFSKIEKDKREGFIDYMKSNWEGSESIEGIEFGGAHISEKNALSICYNVSKPDYGIFIDLNDKNEPIGHLWYD